MGRQEIVFLAIVFVSVVAAWALGLWHSRLYANHVLGHRITEVERHLEQVTLALESTRVEVARIDATALLWHPPADVAEVKHDP